MRASSTIAAAAGLFALYAIVSPVAAQSGVQGEDEALQPSRRSPITPAVMNERDR